MARVKPICHECFSDLVTETVMGKLADATVAEITVRYCPNCSWFTVAKQARHHPGWDALMRDLGETPMGDSND